jgi:HEPN domain-containing protein
MKRQTKHWLDMANDDLMLIGEIVHNEYLTNMVAFHSQQAIEKSFKALLEEKEANVPRVHNIITLKGKIENYIELGINRETFDEINEIYIDSRYPTDLGLLPAGKPPKETAVKFYDLAKEIYTTIWEYLSS